MTPFTLPVVTVTVPFRGDALVIHVTIGGIAGTRVYLMIDGKRREEAGIELLIARSIGFSTVAVLEPGEHVVTLDVESGALDQARLTVEVVRG